MLFRLDPERAHQLSLGAAHLLSSRGWSRAALARLMQTSPTGGQRGVELWGLRFPNRLGLAAGMDKNGVAVPAWSALGFGHVEVGTVTPVAQPGNPRPRLVRLPRSGALVNAMGFNNAGAPALARQLRTHRERGLVDIPVGVSIGKSKTTPVSEAVEDYLRCVAAVRDVADYLAVNVSSPNTPGLRTLQDVGPLRELLGEVVRAAAGLPVLVKLAPDLAEPAVEEALAVAADAGVSGVIAGNTTLRRDHVHRAERALATAAGGLSGSPLTQRSREMVRHITRVSHFPVIGVGGVMTPDDAEAMLDAGAHLVQVYTGLVYGGPALIRGAREL
jgi:dihydroorotate dehydrogenase